MKKICFVATNNFAVENFLKNLIFETSKYYKVLIICFGANKLKKKFKKKNIIFKNVNIDRKINLLKDLLALFKIVSILKKEKIDIVHSIMPKTGFLVAVAGFLAGTKIRIHTFTGQIWCNYRNLKRFFFIKIDELIIYLNNYIFVDSFGQKKFLEKNLIHKKKLKILGNGSVSGFDIDMFKNKLKKKKSRKNTPTRILFVGRINTDKGIFDLLEAFNSLEKKFNIQLIISGSIDDMTIKDKFLNKINIGNILWIKDDIEIKNSYLEADLFCLPSYREGFGNSVVEANIAKLPVLISNIYGFGDIIKNNLYSRKCIPGDIKDLKKNLEKILINIDVYKRKSKKNILKIKKLYTMEKVLVEYIKFYKKITNEQ
tara:strand:+ start:149 stop:1261 length:1113 start_codon:yes stop_codon:yes gene_type:complete